ncbi:MAG TPA: peptide chain release factor N(5)-glutamine methyltransferase [Cellvibrio sp.]|nr:peptide chain release factor N(5)-glutamine methyltransferase [Cellvibrio sp.]
MQQTLLKLLESLQTQLDTLPDKSEESAELTLRALWLCAQGNPVSALRAAQTDLQDLTESQHAHLQVLIAQRVSGIPLAHLSERQSFMGLELRSTPDALIPRRETEILGQLALKCLREAAVPQPLVVDICTGSGNIALAMASHYSEAQVYGSDLSEKAVTLAIDNSQRLALAERVQFRCGDLLEPFREPVFLNNVDLLICNPPYILASNVKKMAKEIAEHEPEMAFDGGPLGIAIIERTVRDAVAFLKPGAWLCLEVGAGQGPFVEKRIVKSGLYHQVETATDEQGVIRALRCRKSSEQMQNG